MTYVGGDALSRLAGTISGFGDLRTVENQNLIELKSIYGTSALRDVETTAGSATIAGAATGEIQLTTTASGSDSAQLNSAERGRYIPGYEASVGIGIRTDYTLSGNMYAEWGLDNGTEGVGFGEDATGFFVYYRRSGSQTKVRPENFSVDSLDGTGPSGLTLDTSEGFIYQINFAWYGYGVIEWEIIAADPNTGLQKSFPIHRYKASGETSIQSPNLPIYVILDNNGTATAANLYVGGRKYAILGIYRPNARFTHDYRLQLGSVGTTWLPVIAFRRKTGFEDVSVKLESISMTPDADMIWKVVTGVTVSGGTWGTPAESTAAETAVEVNKTLTSTSGGITIDMGLVGGTRNIASAGVSQLTELDFIGTDAIVLYVRRTTGTNGTVDALVGVKEEW